jgi:hypothetical protein
MVYYSHSAVCVLLFVFWAWLYNDFPSTVPCVTEIELEKINRNKTKEHIEMDKYVPYKVSHFDPLYYSIFGF